MTYYYKDDRKECVYCGNKFKQDLDHCPRCGKKAVKEGAPIPFDVLIYQEKDYGNPMDKISLINIKINYLEKEISEINAKLDKILEKST
jgi:DNA polymerase III alpha subunit (gram-positive type)